jgi:hypothetical protein
MKFDLIAPCKSCPFRKSVGAVRGLGKKRAQEIGRMMLHPQGGTFTCHSHAHSLGLPKDKDEKHDSATQMMRWMERIGMYDRDKLMAESNQATVDDVFGSLAEFTKAQEKSA